MNKNIWAIGIVMMLILSGGLVVAIASNNEMNPYVMASIGTEVSSSEPIRISDGLSTQIEKPDVPEQIELEILNKAKIDGYSAKLLWINISDNWYNALVKLSNENNKANVKYIEIFRKNDAIDVNEIEPILINNSSSNEVLIQKPNTVNIENNQESICAKIYTSIGSREYLLKLRTRNIYVKDAYSRIWSKNIFGNTLWMLEAKGSFTYNRGIEMLNVVDHSKIEVNLGWQCDLFSSVTSIPHHSVGKVDANADFSGPLWQSESVWAWVTVNYNGGVSGNSGGVT